MILAISRFRVQNGLEGQVKAAFFSRPRLVDTVAGFLGMETYTEIGDPALFYLVTRWTDLASYQAWHKSDLHHRSHRGIPKGLKLDASFTQVVLLERLADPGRSEPVEAMIMDAAPMLVQYLAHSHGLHYLTADLEGIIRDCNRTFASLLRQPVSLLIGQSLWPMLTEADAAILRQRVHAGARDPTDRLLLTIAGEHRSSRTLDCQLDVQPDGFLLIGETSSPS